MILFFNESLVNNCTCKGYNDGLFKPLRIPPQVYDKFMEFFMPMPISKVADVSETRTNLHYMSFTNAQNCLSQTSTNRHWQLQFCVPPQGKRGKM
jgi:hypothetical protein